MSNNMTDNKLITEIEKLLLKHYGFKHLAFIYSLEKLLNTRQQDTESNILKEVVSVKMRHPESKEEIVVKFDIKYLKDIIDTDPDRVFDALGEQFCNCQPVGETNVIECNCIDYLECFESISTGITTESNSAEWVAVSETNPIYQQAIDAWGIQSQVSMAQGECGELIVALTQFFVQGKIDRAKVIDEIADVEIMCSQLRCLFSDVEVDKRKAEKLERLQGILNGSVTHAHTPNRG